MRKISVLLCAITMAVLPMAALAQKDIDKAIDDFAAQTGKNGIISSQIEEGDTRAYARFYNFSLKKKDEKRLEPLKRAFYEDVSEAYDVFIKKDGDNSKTNKRIAYGDNLDKFLNLGWPYYKSGRNYLFMFVDDKADSLARYCYGLEWHYNGGKVEGMVVKILSRNPKKVKLANTLKPKVGEGENEEEIAKFLEKFENFGDSDEADNITVDGNGLKMNGGSMEIKNGKMILKSGKKRVTIHEDGGIEMDDGEGKMSVINRDSTIKLLNSTTDDSTDAGSPAETDAIQKFGNLRAAYLSNIREGNIDNTTLLTGLANSVLDFCKRRGKDMSDDEKALCKSGLDDMISQTPDAYIKGILKLAKNSLDKK